MAKQAKTLEELNKELDEIKDRLETIETFLMTLSQLKRNKK